MYGIYLLVWKGEKKRWKKEKNIPFERLLQLLQEEANSLLVNRRDIEEVLVVGIDLTKRGGGIP